MACARTMRPTSLATTELQSVAVVKVDNRQFLVPAGLLRHHCPVLGPSLASNAPLIRIDLSGIKAHTFKLIEGYIRIGQLPDITVQNVIDLYTASTNLGITPLARACQQRIYSSSVEDQALIYFVECERTNNTADAEASLDMMAKMFTRIALSKGITELNEVQLIKVLDSGPVRRRPQSERFIAALRWLQADCKNRSERSKNLLSRFNLADKTLAGCEVCPEIAKQVPALRLLANQPSQAEMGVTLTSTCYGNSKTTSATISRAPLSGISGGGSTTVEPSPTATAALSKSSATKNTPRRKSKSKPNTAEKAVVQRRGESPTKDKKVKKIPFDSRQLHQSVESGTKAKPNLAGKIVGDGPSKASDVSVPKGNCPQQAQKSPAVQKRSPTVRKSKDGAQKVRSSPRKEKGRPGDVVVDDKSRGDLSKSSPKKAVLEKRPSPVVARRAIPSPEKVKLKAADKPSDAGPPKCPANDDLKRSPAIKKPNLSPVQKHAQDKPGDGSTPKDQAKRDLKKSPAVKMLKLSSLPKNADKPSEASTPKDQIVKRDHKKSPLPKKCPSDKPSEASTPKDKAKRVLKRSPAAKKTNLSHAHEEKPCNASTPKEQAKNLKASPADKPSDASTPKDKAKRDLKRPPAAKRPDADRPSDASTPKDQAKKDLKKCPVYKKLIAVPAHKHADKLSDASTPKDQAKKDLKKSPVAKNLIAMPAYKHADKVSDASSLKEQPKKKQSPAPRKRSKENLRNLSPIPGTAPAKPCDKKQAHVEPASEVQQPAGEKRREANQSAGRGTHEPSTSVEQKAIEAKPCANKKSPDVKSPIAQKARPARVDKVKEADRPVDTPRTVAKKPNKVKKTMAAAEEKPSEKPTEIASENTCAQPATEQATSQSDKASAQVAQKVSDNQLNEQYSELRMRLFAEAKKKRATTEAKEQPAKLAEANDFRKEPHADKSKDEPACSEVRGESPLKAPAAAVGQRRDETGQGPPKKALLKWPRVRSGHLKERKKPEGVKERSRRIWAKVLAGGGVSSKRDQ